MSLVLPRGYHLPWYDDRSVVEYVPTVKAMFGKVGSRPTLPLSWWKEFVRVKDLQIVTFMVDGFGYDQFGHYKKTIPFLKRFEEQGNIHKISTAYPSTTPTGNTAISTGLTSAELGLIEWWQYEQDIDRVIATIQFSSDGKDLREIHPEFGKEKLHNATPIYAELKAHGINSFYHCPAEYSSGVYHDQTYRGSITVPYSELNPGLEKLAETLNNQSGSNYHHFYYNRVDHFMHRTGLWSAEHDKAVVDLFDGIEKYFLPNLKSTKVSNVLLMFIADHGHIEVREDRKIYLTDDPDIRECLRISPRTGDVIPVMGSSRAPMIFAKPNRVDDLLKILKRELSDKAIVLRSSEAIEYGLYGPYQPSDLFRERLGDIVVLPLSVSKNGDSHGDGFWHVWGRMHAKDSLGWKGQHGGLSDREIEVPLGIVKAEKLV
jgi:hypothetical protein